MKGREIMKKSLGFTLAEVLITLGIIGVVAAMTIPTLMNQTSGAEFKSGFKKMVSSLSQAITMNVALDAIDFGGLTESASNDALSVTHMLGQRINIVNSAVGTGEVGDLDTNFGANNYTLLFNDGMVVSYPSDATACTTNTQASCVMIVDVNGAKKPNTLSHAVDDASKNQMSDQFVLDFYGQQVIPHNAAARYALYH